MGLSPLCCQISTKCFDDSKGFPWEPQANLCREAGQSVHRVPPLAARLVTAQARPRRLGVGFYHQSQSALRHHQTTPRGQASRCVPLAKKADVLGSQILWARQGACTLSRPESNVGTWHPHLGVPGPDIQPLIIPWPASHLTALWFDLLGHTIPC